MQHHNTFGALPFGVDKEVKVFKGASSPIPRKTPPARVLSLARMFMNSFWSVALTLFHSGPLVLRSNTSQSLTVNIVLARSALPYAFILVPKRPLEIISWRYTEARI